MTFLQDALKELRMELSTMVLSAGLIMTVLALNRYALGSGLPGIFEDIDLRIGEWMIWLSVIGSVTLLIGLWYFTDTIRKRREFGRLVNTDSKARFVRNRDRIEQLAYQFLGKDYVRRCEEKKKEFGIK